MLSTIYIHDPIFFITYDEFDYPRLLLTEEYRDMRHSYWNIYINSWKKFNKGGAMFWVRFKYEHCKGTINIAILYDTQEQHAIIEMNQFVTDEGGERFQYNTRYIPRPEGMNGPPTLLQTLCDIGFTNDEICELQFTYEINDYIHLTYEEKSILENDEDPFESYDF